MNVNRFCILGLALLVSFAGSFAARACSTHGLVQAATLDSVSYGPVNPNGPVAFWIGIEDRLVVPQTSGLLLIS